MIFGEYNEISFYFQLSVTMWCLISLHGNYNYISNATSSRQLGFLSFQVLLKFQL